MGRAALSTQICTVARAAALVGDEWTIMILREMFLGTHRFDDFLRQTGMSSHLLSQRLKKLETAGVVRRAAYSQRPPRYEYRLTEMELDLDGVFAHCVEFRTTFRFGTHSLMV